MVESSGSDRSNWEAVRCADLDDMRTQNIRFWQRQGGRAIREAAWELVVDAWEIKQRDPDELRFQRSVATVRRA